MTQRRFQISIIEAFVAVTFLSSGIALLAPAVNQARYGNDNVGSPMLDGFTPFSPTNGWSTTQRILFIPAFAFAGGAAAVGVLVTLKTILPQILRERIVWRPTTGPLSSATKSELFFGILLTVFLATALLLSISGLAR